MRLKGLSLRKMHTIMEALVTRSTIHDKVRNFGLSHECESAIIDYLDAKTNVYGKPYSGHTPHYRVKMSKNVAGVTQDIQMIMTRFPQDSLNYRAVVFAFNDMNNWRSEVFQEKVPPGPITNDVKVIDVKSRKELQALLKENGIKFGGRSSRETLLQLALTNGIV